MPLMQTSGNATADAYAGGAAAAPLYIEDFFQTYLRTGTGASATITTGLNGSTKETLVWTKSRSAATDHKLTDNVRGATKALSSNTTAAEATDSQGLTAFNATGYTIGTNTDYNNSGATYVDWQWVSQPKFFDVVTYTGTGSNTTIAHNLGSVPGCIIVKRTNTAADWAVYHRSLANTQYLVLNDTVAAATGATWWNSTTPTSAVFSLGTDASVNASGGTYVAYLFAHNAGGFGLTGTDNVISCGTFTTDGSGNATVNLGYEPQYILMKQSSGVQNWVCYDIMRGWAQAQQAQLYPNITQAEDMYTGSPYFFPTATGFSLSGTFGLGNNATFIYIAIRRGPMKVPTLGTSVFSPIASSDTQGTQQTTGFPVDLQIAAYRPGNANNSTANDRLRGVSSTSTGNTSTPLVTSSTAAETAGGIGTQGWNNTGFGIPAFLSISSSIYWNFRRAPSFFDEVCYTGNGSTQTITHNLGVTPELIIAKNRGQAGNNWPVLFNFASTTMNYGFLNLTNSYPNDTYANVGVFSAAPTSTSMFLVSSGSMNASGYGIVAYLFATCAGVSKVGTYTGNGTTQTINCGFTGGARFVLIKATSTTGNWMTFDTARGMTVLTDPFLSLNSSAAETATLGACTTVSTGFAVNESILAGVNTSSVSFVFLAIA